MQSSSYEQFIAKTRYARYLENKGRRENWTESVDRYMNFMKYHLKSKHEYDIDPDTFRVYHLHDGLSRNNCCPRINVS